MTVQSAAVQLCMARCLDYNDIIPFYKEHYYMLATTSSLPCVARSASCVPHLAHSFLTPGPSSPLHHILLSPPDAQLNFISSSLSHLSLFFHLLTIASLIPPLLSPLPTCQYLLSKTSTCVPRASLAIYSWSRGVYNSVESCGSCTFLGRVQLTTSGLLC